MRIRGLGFVLGLAVSMGVSGLEAQVPDQPVDDLAALRVDLQALLEGSDSELFQHHFRSVIQVIDTDGPLSTQDLRNVQVLRQAFGDESYPYSPRLPESYLNRSRQLIIAWTSPTDGQVSFTWLRLPAAWNPESEYPLYVQLHGLWSVAADRIEYLTYPFVSSGSSFAFEDGYLISPWGRGNLWYRGIAETDIWECIQAVQTFLRLDPRRLYLCGHSMGGYGAWHIGHRSAAVWAALGIHAGALWYGNNAELTPLVASELRNVPTCFVIGDFDPNLLANQVAYWLLTEAGNPHLAFITFPAGHDYRPEDVEDMYQWMRGFQQGTTAR
jgi:hypothetical protein